MPPNSSNTAVAGQRGLNGIEFMHRSKKVLESINKQAFPKINDILIPYIHYHFHLIDIQMQKDYHNNIRKKVESYELMRKDVKVV